MSFPTGKGAAMVKVIDKVQRRVLISEAAERNRRREAGGVWSRSFATCRTCGTRLEAGPLAPLVRCRHRTSAAEAPRS